MFLKQWEFKGSGKEIQRRNAANLKAHVEICKRLKHFFAKLRESTMPFLIDQYAGKLIFIFNVKT